jgi:3'(2'), 5'-bisphosphate nucleotidase
MRRNNPLIPFKRAAGQAQTEVPSCQGAGRAGAGESGAGGVSGSLLDRVAGEGWRRLGAVQSAPIGNVGTPPDVPPPGEIVSVITAAPPFTEPTWLDAVIRIVRDAGAVIMSIYATDFAVRGKSDASPVTEADERAERLIVDALRRLAPQVPIIAEEAVAAGGRVEAGEWFWLVDPLDGTKEFISRNGEFTVNVALVHDGVPVLGVVLAPALDRLFAGVAGHGAFVEEAGVRRPIGCRSAPAQGLTVVASRSHGDAAALDAFLAGRPVAALVSAGSSLKLCLVAAGEADLYPRLGRTMEWDIAAGHAVLLAAGGTVRDLHGAELRYGKAGCDNPHFVAGGLA